MNKSKKSLENQGSQFTVIPNWILLDETLTPSEKILLARIINYHNQEGCYASNDHLAMGVANNVKYLQKLLKSLEEKGYIKRYPSKINTTGREIKVLKMWTRKRKSTSKSETSKSEVPPTSKSEVPPTSKSEVHNIKNNKESNKEKEKEKEMNGYWNINGEVAKRYKSVNAKTTIEMIHKIQGSVNDDKLTELKRKSNHIEIAKAVSEMQKALGEGKKYTNPRRVLINGLLK